MIENLLLVEGILLLILLISPTLTFLTSNMKQRRSEILSGISREGGEAIKLYFRQFHPDFAPNVKDTKKRFDLFYKAHFGPRHFILPIFLFLTVSGTLLFECNYFLTQSIRNSTSILEEPQAIFIFSVLGAYMWVLNNHISKWWDTDLSHDDLYWASFRFAICVPMGYAVTRMLGKGADISLALAFFLGAFPMQTLLSFFRKISIKRLGIEDAIEKAGSEILKLQGIDRIKAECLATEGVTTICQLAYADPIRLTIRTNLGYSFLVDCISQAQLRIYTGDYHEKWQRLGLRGGFEVINLSSGLESEDVTQKDDANMLIAELAESLGVSRSAVREIIWEVCNDPYMEFVYSSWVSSKKDSIASGSDKG